VYVAFFERYRPWLYVCNMPFHMSETCEQNRLHYFEEVKFFLYELMSCRKNEREDELHSRMYCIFPHIVFFYRNTASYLRLRK
jgi:hypothetical protein